MLSQVTLSGDYSFTETLQSTLLLMVQKSDGSSDYDAQDWSELGRYSCIRNILIRPYIDQT